ncbi:MAG: 6-carboxytetrahydropterin synthase [Verrucomicrobiales bacterium]|jgi:6-pyruvoyltetrahydropterin/6-carboxytetrahydropterin synthase|nr:6-carboxytetrahydropterin synthase [Verrucomicrobiales bacterium]
MEVTLSREFRFDAAQALTIFPEGHKCRRLHGHSFKLVVQVRGPIDADSGLLYDHAAIKQAVAPLLELVDHSYLNELPGLANPTIELMCVWFWDRLKDRLPGLDEIALWETPGAWCRYRGK